MRRCRLPTGSPSKVNERRSRCETSPWTSTSTSVRWRSQKRVRCARPGTISTKPEELELFAQSLDARDRVALEVTGNAWAIKRIIEPHVAEVVVVSPTDTGIRGARAKTDRLDARRLARLLAAGELDGVWMPDRETR